MHAAPARVTRGPQGRRPTLPTPLPERGATPPWYSVEEGMTPTSRCPPCVEGLRRPSPDGPDGPRPIAACVPPTGRFRATAGHPLAVIARPPNHPVSPS